MKTFCQDVRYGARIFLKNAGFTSVAIITLALGIGANTAIFSIINTVLLRPLDYDKPEQLVALFDALPSIGFQRTGLSEAEFVRLRNESRSFAEIATWNRDTATLRGAGEPERVASAKVSANFFRTLGSNIALGRDFNAKEEFAGHSNVVVLSNGFWQRRFAGDSAIIGESLSLDGQSFTVIGVLPATFKSPPELQADTRIDIWQGYGFDPASVKRGNHGLSVIGRLREGVPLEQAQTETSHIISVVKDNPDSYPADLRNFILPLHQSIVGDVRPALLVMLAAVAVVLMIACANVANLLLARSESRQKEMALRSALGASRSRIVRQLLIESLMLSTVGGIVGLLLAQWMLDAMLALGPENIPRLAEVSLDLSVLGFALFISVFTALVFGLAPALQAIKFDLHTMLKEGGRSATGQVGRSRLRNALIVIETALAIILLVTAGLLARSFWNLQRVNTGFIPDNLLTMRLTPPGYAYNNNQKINDLYTNLIDRVKALPGVSAAATADPLPISGSNRSSVIEIEGRTLDMTNLNGMSSDARVVSPEYFQTLGIRLIKGRLLETADREGALPVAVVNETFARNHWPGEDAIGKRFRYLDGPPDRATSKFVTIVGIVADAKNRAISEAARQEALFPLQQHATTLGRIGLQQSHNLAVRVSGHPDNLIDTLRQEVRAVEPDFVISRILSMDRLMDASIIRPRFNMILICTFALISLGLGAIGIYGVIAYSVTQRTHEIGVRMALGACQSNVLKMIIVQGMSIVLIGVAAGLAGAMALTRILASLLYGVSATDPVTYFVIAILLTLVAFAACYIPARRATKVDPMVALRYE